MLIGGKLVKGTIKIELVLVDVGGEVNFVPEVGVLEYFF